jgi:hypothetical protein
MARSSASKPSSSSGGTASSTPARNNYAAPHTPIASVKRPRSSIDKSMLSPGSSKAGIPTTPLDTDSDNANMAMTPKTPGTGKKDALAIDESNLPMSPMHPARPLVARKGGGDDAGHHHGALKALPLPALEGIAEGEVHAQDVDREKGEEGSWVGRQVDALFSPVLNYINGEDDVEEGHGHGHQVREHPHNHDKYSDGAVKAKAKSKETSDGDVSMEDAKQQQVPPQVSDTSQTTSQETEEEEEEVGDDLHHHRHEDEASAEGLVEDDGSSQGSVDDEDEFNPYVFIKSLPNYDLVAPLRPPIALPPKLKESPPISLVLDLDETLVHCTVEPIDDADLVFPVVFHGVTYQVHVRLRPHLFQFLEKIRGKYEVIVFTASQKVYANELLDLIDPGKQNCRLD